MRGRFTRTVRTSRGVVGFRDGLRPTPIPRRARVGAGRPVCRLGLASYGKTSITPEDIFHAIGRGINFLNWAGLADGPAGGDAFTGAVAALGPDRPSVVVCVQFGSRRASDAAAELGSVLATLGTDYIDVLTLYYVERPGEWRRSRRRAGVRYLRDAKRDGTVRRLGVTSHQRKLAATMAESGLLDLVMVRYNAAHRGAERDVFPVTKLRRDGRDRVHRPAGRLIRPTTDDPPGFPVPRAPDWYRFVLQHPAVAVAVAAPQSERSSTKTFGSSKRPGRSGTRRMPPSPSMESESGKAPGPSVELEWTAIRGTNDCPTAIVGAGGGKPDVISVFTPIAARVLVSSWERSGHSEMR